MGSFKNGWKIAKMCLSVARKDKEMLLYPILSAILTIAALLVVLGGTYSLVPYEALSSDAGAVVVLFVVYQVTIYVATFFNVAIMHAASIRLSGGNPTLKDGIGKAKECSTVIFKWSVFAAVVGVAIRILRSRRGASAIGGVLAEMAWGIATFFVVPVLAYEKLGPRDAMKRSAELVKGFFARDRLFAGLISNASLSVMMLVILALTFVAGLSLFVMLAPLGFAGLAIAAVVFIAGIAAAVSLNAVVNGIWIAVMYQYVTTGKMPDVMDKETLNAISASKQPALRK